MAGNHVRPPYKVPPGTKDSQSDISGLYSYRVPPGTAVNFFRPCGTWLVGFARGPSHEWLGYFQSHTQPRREYAPPIPKNSLIHQFKIGASSLIQNCHQRQPQTPTAFKNPAWGWPRLRTTLGRRFRIPLNPEGGCRPFRIDPQTTLFSGNAPTTHCFLPAMFRKNPVQLPTAQTCPPIKMSSNMNHAMGGPHRLVYSAVTRMLSMRLKFISAVSVPCRARNVSVRFDVFMANCGIAAASSPLNLPDASMAGISPTG
jgi:hypothetical protein